MPAAAPVRLVVAPSLLADTGRELAVLTDAAASRLAAHALGPRPAPALGDPACASAYATGQHQLAGLVTLAVGRTRALADGLAVAAALYRVLDGSSGAHASGPGAAAAGESLAELGPVSAAPLPAA